jgi:hypothetical protein
VLSLPGGLDHTTVSCKTQKNFTVLLRPQAEWREDIHCSYNVHVDAGIATVTIALHVEMANRANLAP